jgi:hypothetical protein
MHACYRRAECTEVLWVHLHLLQHEYRAYNIKVVLFTDDVSAAAFQCLLLMMEGYWI